MCKNFLSNEAIHKLDILVKNINIQLQRISLLSDGTIHNNYFYRIYYHLQLILQHIKSFSVSSNLNEFQFSDKLEQYDCKGWRIVKSTIQNWRSQALCHFTKVCRSSKYTQKSKSEGLAKLRTTIRYSYKQRVVTVVVICLNLQLLENKLPVSGQFKFKAQTHTVERNKRE